MPILADASHEVLSRLLALFPVAQLKETWNDIEAEDKESLCDAVADGKSAAQIANFVNNAIGYCKQHVYLFKRHGNDEIHLPTAIAGGERVKHTPQQNAVYVAELTTDVVLLDPVEETSIEFLWPIRVEVLGRHVSIRVVVLEKDIPSYFDRRTLTKGHSITEEAIIDGIKTDLALNSLDIHKGMKELWEDEFMDCHLTRYRKTKSSAVEIVDRTEQKGIRENDLALFKTLMKSEMRESLFYIEDTDIGAKKVSIDPSVGRLAFLQYASKAGAIEHVVRKILQNN